MRYFAKYYDARTKTWHVIFRDDGEEEWFHFVEVPGESEAHVISDALNRSQRSS